MLKTFNCGVGSLFSRSSKKIEKIKKFFKKKYKPYLIGEIVAGKNKVKLNEKINWSKKSKNRSFYFRKRK